MGPRRAPRGAGRRAVTSIGTPRSWTGRGGRGSCGREHAVEAGAVMAGPRRDHRHRHRDRTRGRDERREVPGGGGGGPRVGRRGQTGAPAHPHPSRLSGSARVDRGRGGRPRVVPPSSTEHPWPRPTASPATPADGAPGPHGDRRRPPPQREPALASPCDRERSASTHRSRHPRLGPASAPPACKIYPRGAGLRPGRRRPGDVRKPLSSLGFPL
jgi:hypothetical protein